MQIVYGNLFIQSSLGFSCITHNKAKFHTITIANIYIGTYRFPLRLSSKGSTCNAEVTGDRGSIPGSGRSPGGRHGNSFQYSCLENPVDRGAWRATFHGVTQSRTRLKRLSTHTCAHTHTEKETDTQLGGGPAPHQVLWFQQPLGPHPKACHRQGKLRISEQRPWPSEASVLWLHLCKVSVQFSRSVLSDSLRPHGPQHARTPCPSPTPGACSHSCPLSR